jgi:membrane associated rhomboid family serine protease
MDWSLVLISQEIENTIRAPNEEHGWQILVSGSDFDRALETLNQYRSENRQRRWRQELPVGGLIFDWRSVLWFILPVVFYYLSQTRQEYLVSSGVMDTAKVWAGQWWRLFTAMLLHANPPHLALNLTFGILLLGLAMGSFGPGLALLGAYLAGAGGNLVVLFIFPQEHRSLGASGMVMGALGLLAGQSLALLRSGMSAPQFILRGIIGGVLLLVLLGLDPTSDVVAHVGGFGFGLFIGGLLSWVTPKLAQNPWANWLAEAICGLLVILTWWLALRAAP